MSEYVWVNPTDKGEFEVSIGARILSRDARRVKILDDEGQERWVEASEILRPMHFTSVEGVEDMIVLGDLQEHAILRNLLIRYSKDLIYTYTGTMLVAVNPYKPLPIYSKKDISLYKGRKIGELPPHIFAVGDNSYRNMRNQGVKQCIVISGESGAGKTESTKLILQYVATISQKHSWIEQQILDSNPVLEAFGNARTVRNDNSSRFGKYMALLFDADYSISGAKIEQYLLEKSRLVSQNEGERNYHIFYSMLAGLNREDKVKLGLEDASCYRYLTGGNVLTCDDRDESVEFANITSAMKVLNFAPTDIDNIFQLLAAILHMGNLDYKPTTIANIEGCELLNTKHVERIAGLLGTSPAQLTAGLTKRSLTTQNDTVSLVLSVQQAGQVRDAFVKAIYGNLFIYIVNKINAVIKPQSMSSDRYLGVLDIFGFENFKNNSFEQLCINLANENLQQFFIHHIFKLEQEQYTNEGIDWKHIKFVDNQAILNMIAVQPMNILALIDEEAKFPKGTDDTMLAKIVAEHEPKAEFFRPKYKGVEAFGIYHFAGAVFYNVKDFLEKDRDSFSADLKLIAENSRNQFLRALFPLQTGIHQGKKKDTLALKFRQSLDELMTELGKCQPFFVRCIKPNDLKKQRLFDRPLCCRQLRYSGMMETAKVRQAGFPIRYPFQQFVERYRVLGRAIPPAHRADCKAATAQICNMVFGARGEYRLGFTQIFLKTSEDLLLNTEREKALSKYILLLQRNIRGWLQRRRYQKLRKAAVVIQSHWRGRGPRRQFLIVSRGYSRLQARLRSRLLTHKFSVLRRRVTKLQAYCKGFAIRQSVQQRVREQQGRMKELMNVRRREEVELKRAGKKDWKEIATANWRAEIAKLKIRVKEEDLEEGTLEAFDEDDDEEQAKIVDNVFGFLDDASNSSVMKELGIGKGTYNKGEDYIGLNDDSDDGEDLSEFNFRKFAATYFRGNVAPHYQRRPLRHSLLDGTDFEFDAAARALWITTLRFMGDLAEPRYEQDTQKAVTPVMMQISKTLGRKFAQSAAYQDAIAMEKDETRRRKLISMTLKKSNKIGAGIRQAMLNENAEEGYTDWLNTRTTNLDKLHFIIGHGILKPQLRDEILAQVCKQLTRNPSKSSFARGWVLLSLCVGCFAPSDLLLNPLKAFLQAGPAGYAKFCLHRLKRTAENGPRSQPPSWVELQAIKYKKPIDVPVTLMDGSSRTVQVDSAMTAAELIASVSRHIGLVDSYGFSVFISLYDKTSSLGGGGEHVLDAVSQCEQYAREQGQNERSASWRIFIRKEMFAPWHDSAADPVATQLISQQVVRGFRSGEYRCEREADLAMLAAQQYYMEHGLLDVRKVTTALPNLIPSHIFKTLNDDKLRRWVKLIEDAYEKNLKTRPKIDSVKQEIVTFAKNKWPLMFSRFFEVIELSGQTALPKQPIVAAVNWTGVFFVDQSEQVLLELSYVEIQSVALKQPGSTVLLHLITIEGIEMVFQGPNCNELHDVIKNLLAEIKKRSKFVVATKNYIPPEEEYATKKPLIKGDLLQLTDNQTGESVAQSTWIEAYNERTQETGHVPSDCVAVVASAIAPSPAVLSLLKEGPAAVSRAPGVGTIRRMKLYTLENYSREHFRIAGRASTVSRGTSLSSIRQNEMEELWRHSREPIKRPLLRRLQQDEELSACACIAFIAILKYMGDQPSRRQRIGSEYTDKIFEAALKHEPLRDEIYCQIMKQLTGNRNQFSDERGWELMYLVTGLFPCSAELETELFKFLQSRRTSDIAQDCQLRFQRILASGARRHPPHQVEVDAIQHKHKQIYHRVYFPDDSDAAFEVDSYTRASDMIATIAKKLQLKSCDGFSLFIKVWNKVLSVPEKDFFFDYVRLVTDWIKKNLPGESTGQMQYQIFFMRKLWTASVAGRDRNADLIFHFPQELPKYLRGYHKVSKNDASQLAALVFIAKFESSAVETASPQTIQGLIPADVYKQQKPKDWQKAVTAAMKQHKGLVADDAKIEFLRFIQQWPTFGSAFFEVKQTTETNYPELILVAINRRGVFIINPITKDILAEHDYTNISNWSSGNTYFNMYTGVVTRGGGGGRLLMETPLGYKMDDLIASYTAMLHTINVRRKSVKARAPAPPPN